MYERANARKQLLCKRNENKKFCLKVHYNRIEKINVD